MAPNDPPENDEAGRKSRGKESSKFSIQAENIGNVTQAEVIHNFVQHIHEAPHESPSKSAASTAETTVEEKPDMTTAANILHLSDLHFGTVEDAKRWHTQLAEDLKNELNCHRLDALILSGDIRQQV